MTLSQLAKAAADEASTPTEAKRLAEDIKVAVAEYGRICDNVGRSRQQNNYALDTKSVVACCNKQDVINAAIDRLAALASASPKETINSRIAGALFDFLGFLTTSETRWTFSAYDDASPAVLALGQWAAKRNLPLEPAAVKGWNAATSTGDTKAT